MNTMPEWGEKMLTTKTRIINYLQYKNWVSGSELEGMADSWYTKASVISRRCRELVNEGKLIRDISSKGTVQYHYHETKRVLSTQEANVFLEQIHQEEIKQGALL